MFISIQDLILINVFQYKFVYPVFGKALLIAVKNMPLAESS